MLGDCKECGCQCRSCTNSLDLHHEIETLTAQLTEAKLSIAQLLSQTKNRKSEEELIARKHSEELQQLEERYQRLYVSHKSLEKINHDLEDKILLLVQSNESEREATIKIHQALQVKVKHCEQTVQTVNKERDQLVAHCRHMIDILEKYQSEPNLSLEDDEGIEEIQSTLSDYEQRATEISKPAETTPTVIVSTFPPCAIAFNSPKVQKKLGVSSLASSRNASDSRLSLRNQAEVITPTDLWVCSQCRSTIWTCDAATQTPSYDFPLPEFIDMPSRGRIFDI